jgi:preprotein translocase subunit SecG
MAFIGTILLIVNIIMSISLIALVMLQTTKSEGLSGTIGGKAQSTFRGKPGWDDKLNLYTKYAAGTWLVTSLIVAYAFVMH